jgi:hypothetical protein
MRRLGLGNSAEDRKRTTVNAESTPSHASRQHPVRQVVDFWEGPIPGPERIEEAEVSAMEDRVDCYYSDK